jgi:hypothetical protein
MPRRDEIERIRVASRDSGATFSAKDVRTLLDEIDTEPYRVRLAMQISESPLVAALGRQGAALGAIKKLLVEPYIPSPLGVTQEQMGYASVCCLCTGLGTVTAETTQDHPGHQFKTCPACDGAGVSAGRDSSNG